MKSCFVDCETTGLTENHGIIQIAGALFNDATLLETFNIRMRPFDTDRIEDEALAVNGVTREQLATFQHSNAGYKEFQRILGKHINKYDRSDKAHFIGHNADFDADMIRAWFKKNMDDYFGSWFYYPILDVSKLAGIRLMRERHTLQNFKLMTVAKHLWLVTDEEVEAGAHDAMLDVRITMRMFKLLTRDLSLFGFKGQELPSESA